MRKSLEEGRTAYTDTQRVLFSEGKVFRKLGDEVAHNVAHILRGIIGLNPEEVDEYFEQIHNKKRK